MLMCWEMGNLRLTRNEFQKFRQEVFCKFHIHLLFLRNLIARFREARYSLVNVSFSRNTIKASFNGLVNVAFNHGESQISVGNIVVRDNRFLSNFAYVFDMKNSNDKASKRGLILFTTYGLDLHGLTYSTQKTVCFPAIFLK